MVMEVVCVKMEPEDKAILDAFAEKHARGNRSKVIKDAILMFITREEYST